MALEVEVAKTMGYPKRYSFTDRTAMRDFFKVEERIVEEQSGTDFARTHASPPRFDVRLELTDNGPFASPFWDHAHGNVFVVYQDWKPAATVAGIVDPEYWKAHPEMGKVGWFGWLSTINDPNVLAKAMGKVESYLREDGCNNVMGPVNPSLSYGAEAGVLIDGFGETTKTKMTKNPPYLGPLLESLGYGKRKDLISYVITEAAFLRRFGMQDKNLRKDQIIAKLQEKKAEKEAAWRKEGLEVRARDMKMFPFSLFSDTPTMGEMYSEIWKSNWGSMTLTKEEQTSLGSQMAIFSPRRFVRFIEVNGKPAAFYGILPNYARHVFHGTDGRLTPKTIGKFLKTRFYSAEDAFTDTEFRLAMFGRRQEYAHLKLATYMFLDACEVAYGAGTTKLDASWVLEDNRHMAIPIVRFGGKKSEVRRLYGKSL